MKILRFLALATLLMVVSSCYKDKDTTTEEYIPDHPVMEVEAQYCGFAYHPNGNAIAGVTAEVASHNTSSDTRGYFDLNLVQSVQDEGAILLHKYGYFPLVLSFSSIAGQTMLFETTLWPYESSLRKTFNESADLKYANHGRITVPSSSLIESQSGLPLTTEYLVSIKRLNNAEKSSYTQMSQLLTIENDVHHIITPEEILLINLQETNGAFLESINDLQIEMHVPSYSSEMSIYQQTNNGIFEQITPEKVEGGIAYINTQNAGHLVMGRSEPAHVIEIEVKSSDHYPIVYSPLTFPESPGWLVKTGSLGKCRVFISDDQTRFNVEDNCQQIIGEFKISENQKTLVTTATSFNDYMYIAGEVKSCSGQPLSSGYIQREKGGTLIKTPISANGKFAFVGQGCESSILEAEVFERNVHEPLETLNLPNYGQQDDQFIIVCEQDYQTEAILNIESNAHYFEECTLVSFQDDGGLTRMEFNVAGIQNDERHVFVFNSVAGTGYWKSPSLFTEEGLQLINIRGNPRIDQFVLDQVNYTSVIFEEVLFQSQTDDKLPGQISYTFVTP